MKSIAEQFLNPEGIITDEELIAFAEQRPFKSPEVQEVLIRWIRQQEVPEDQDFGGLVLFEIALKVSTMKYMLGFLTKDEVLKELNDIEYGLACHPEHTQGLNPIITRLNDLVSEIENNNFKFITGQEDLAFKA
jgi:hypothetical protein